MPQDVLLACEAALRDGADFPTVWDTVLRRHPLVMGPPIQIHHDDKPHLEIPLMSGQRLLYSTSDRRYFFL
jgi:hypothetical protein